jgi:hypothetical protein
MPDHGALRIHIYDRLLERGAPPTLREIAGHFGEPETEVRRAVAELKIGKTVLPHPQTGEIWMAGPFASAETTYRVSGSRTRWWANCAWDMFGVAVIANEVVDIEARCGDCDAPMTLRGDPNRAPPEHAVVHFLVPARHWYDDIGFT